MAVLVLFSSVPLFMVADKNFLPNDDQSEFEINLRAPEGTSLESTEVITNRIANAIRSQTPEVDYTLVQIAGDGPKTRNLATIYVRLTPIEERRRDQFAVMDDVREPDPAAARRPDLRTSVQPVANIGGGGNQNADIQFIINGPDLAKLDTYSKQLVGARAADAGRRRRGHVAQRRQAGSCRCSVDRPKAADLGVQIADAAEALRLLVGGDQVTTYNEGGEQYEVHLRAQAANRSTAGGRRAADRAVGSRSGTRVARQRGDVLARLGAVRHQPPAPAAPGHRVRQPAAGRLAGRSAERDGGRVQEPERRTGISRRPHRAGRASSGARRRTSSSPSPCR